MTEEICMYIHSVSIYAYKIKKNYQKNWEVYFFPLGLNSHLSSPTSDQVMLKRGG